MPHGGEGRLIPIALDHPTIELAVAAVYPFDRRPPAKVRAFLDFLEQRIEASPQWDRFIEPAKTSSAAEICTF